MITLTLIDTSGLLTVNILLLFSLWSHQATSTQFDNINRLISVSLSGFYILSKYILTSFVVATYLAILALLDFWRSLSLGPKTWTSSDSSVNSQTRWKVMPVSSFRLKPLPVLNSTWLPLPLLCVSWKTNSNLHFSFSIWLWKISFLFDHICDSRSTFLLGSSSWGLKLAPG